MTGVEAAQTHPLGFNHELPNLKFERARRMERAMLAGDADDIILRLGDCQISVWTTEQALIVPSGMPTIAHYQEASDQMAGRGWPVYERDSGGDVTPQFSGILNISMTFTLSDTERNITAAYGRLTAPVIEFLKTAYGISAYASSVDGAFCDGAHNIVIDGRKVAGTAQRWRLMPAHANSAQSTRVLAHIALVCGQNLDGALDAVNKFYRACRINRAVVRQAHITLEDMIGTAEADPSRIAQKFAEYVSAGRSKNTLPTG
jgi:hypothetical protein